MIYLKYDLNRKLKGFYDTSSFNYKEDFSTTFIKVTDKLRNKIIQRRSNIELVTLDIDKEKIYDEADYDIIFQTFSIDNSFIHKTPIQLIQEENEKLKKENEEIKVRQEAIQNALDALIMESINI